MALNPTLLEAGSDTNAAAATVISTGSVSPDDAQQHFLAVLLSAGTVETPAVAGCGLTWAADHALDFSDSGAPGKRIILFEGTGTVSGTPDTVDMTFAAAPTGVAWVLFDADGIAASPLVEYVDDFSDVGVSSLTIGDLTDFTDTPTDGAMVVFAKNQNNVVTIESGWTQLGHAGYDTPASSLTVAWRADPDLQNVMTLSTGTAKCAGFIVRVTGETEGGTATQSSTYLAEINRLLSRGGRIAARLAARRRAGVDITEDLTALRAVYADLYSKHDELLQESLDIDDPLVTLGVDRDTLLANAGNVGEEPPTPVALLKGLMARSTESSNAAVEHYNPEIGWDELQPIKGGPIDTDVIGSLIAAGDSFRVRLFNGYRVPQWLKDEVGTVSTLFAQTPSDPPVEVVKYWDPAVAGYYDDLMQKLAAEYDGVIPLIFEAMCMAVYAEPCLKQFNNADNRAAWLAAGYTSAADFEAFNNALDIMAAHWHETRVGVAYNGYQLLTSTGGTTTSYAQSKTLMQRHRALFGERAVLQNNSIRESYLANPTQTYTDMLELGPPISFQTATLARVGNLATVLDWCIDTMGAHAVEWPGNQGLSQAQLDDYDARLRANP